MTTIQTINQRFWFSIWAQRDQTSDFDKCQDCVKSCVEMLPVHKLTRHNLQIDATWHAIKALYSRGLLLLWRENNQSQPVGPFNQTLRGLINVPANFHKWGINYNWFHSLIHLLKWHPFIHMLTCHQLCLLRQTQLAHNYCITFTLSSSALKYLRRQK